MSFHLAQVNIGRLVAPVDDPKIAEFLAQLEGVNALADAAPGFQWRLQSSSGNATDVPYNDDPFVLVNMSLWESVEALRDYVYRSQHVEVMRDRAKWFEKMEKPHYCLWWVPAGHLPTVAEARERLEHYQEHGATPRSFWFSQPFDAPVEQGSLA
jgi:heme-degrading monooxygenase HmoA